jgi:hypothetical protein
VPAPCEALADAACCALPALVAPRVANAPPVWTAVLSADATVDATAAAARGGGAIALTVPHLAAAGLQIAAFAAADADAGAAGVVTYRCARDPPRLACVIDVCH